MSGFRQIKATSGQVTVEVAILLPVIVVVVMGFATLFSVGVARELANHAAKAGAVALLQEQDPKEAVQNALPHWSKRRVAIRVRKNHVVVQLTPPLPIRQFARLFAVRAEADADFPGNQR